MTTAKTTLKLLPLVLLLLGVSFLLPSYALAAPVISIGDPYNESTWHSGAYPAGTPSFSAVFGAPSDYNLAAIEFPAAYTSNDPLRLVAYDYTISAQLDCQTEYFVPSSYMPAYSGGTLQSTGDYAVVQLNFTGSGCAIDDSHNVVIQGQLQSGGSMNITFAGWITEFARAVMVIYDSPFPPDDTRTRIIDVVPPPDPTGSLARATSTAFAFETTGFVNEADFVEGMFVRMTARNTAAMVSNAAGPSFTEGGRLFCSWLPNWLCPQLPGEEEAPQLGGVGAYVFDFPIESPGDFSFATTTDVQIIGRYTMNTEILRPNSTFLGAPVSFSAFASLPSQFTVATSTAFDIAVGGQVAAILAQKQAINPECYFDILSPGNWVPAIQTCMTSIFAVPVDYVADGLMGAMADLLSHAPWGYATRTYAILTSDTSSSTLPSLGTTVPEGLPMGGTTLPDFAPWDGIEVAVAQLDIDDVPTMDKSPLDQFEFWWNFMWCLVFAFWLLREFYGLVEAGDFEDLSEHLPGSRRTGRGIAVYKELNDARNASYKGGMKQEARRIVNRAQMRTDSIKRKYHVKGY